MEKSTHVVEVVPVVLEKHPNADTLSLVSIFDGGYTVIVRTADWEGKTIGAYIPPDSIVPDTKEYDYLGGHLRIKARRFRGIMSMGLLVDAPVGFKIGDNVADILKITHYEPYVNVSLGGSGIRKQKKLSKWVKLLNVFRKLFGIPIPGRWKDILPSGIECPDYDVDSLRKYKHIFEEGEPVWITEKIHGTNARFFFYKDKMCCGSHHQWYKQDEKCLWWRILTVRPEIEKFCKEHPGYVLYGEIYNVQKGFNYGLKPGEVDIVFYDIRNGLGKHEWVNPEDARIFGFDLPWVPVVYNEFPFNFDKLVEMVDNLKTQMLNANHVAEGIVIKPLIERIHRNFGRVQLKLVSNTYLEKSKDEPFENLIPELNKV